VSQWFTTLVDSINSVIKWDNPLTVYGRGQAARRKIVDYIRQVIRERATRGDLQQSTDVLSLLLNTVDEDGNKFTETQVINQAIGLLFAGGDTTSSLISWLLFELFIFPMLTHRLPEIYKNPDAFDPDRFALPREEDQKQPYSLIGFGGGVHSCLGVELAKMEMKIILSTLLQKYDWTVTPTTAEISPVRQPAKMQKQLKATFVSIES
jgi:cytochrome P450